MPSHLCDRTATQNLRKLYPMIYEFKGFVPVIDESAFVHPQATIIGNVTIGKDVYVGPGAVIRGDWGEIIIKENCMIGMNSVVMDRVDVGAESIVGAMAFVKADTVVPPRSLVVGNPAKVIKKVSDEMINWKTKGTLLYQSLPKDMHESLREVEPLRTPQKDKPSQEILFQTWNDIKK